jgi:hypothetical protein
MRVRFQIPQPLGFPARPQQSEEARRRGTLSGARRERSWGTISAAALANVQTGLAARPQQVRARGVLEQYGEGLSDARTQPQTRFNTR